MAYSPTVAGMARSILQHALDAAESAGRGEPDGLRVLIEALVMEVQLCNLIGHSRPEEGSEHYFAYCAEQLSDSEHSHGELVGPGIVEMARQHDLDVAPLERALRDCHVPLDRLPEATVQQVLRELPAYCRRHALPHGIAHDLDHQQV